MRRSKEELQRLRTAKRRNRERRLRRWKDKTRTVPPCLQMFRRQMANLQRSVIALGKSLKPVMKQITDCVGLIPAVFCGGNSNEQGDDI